MAETLFILFLILPAVLGMAEILHLLKSFLLGCTVKGRRYSIVFLENEDAVTTLRTFCEEKNWYGRHADDKLFAVYKELSQEVLVDCREIAEKNDIIFLSADSLGGNIEEFY